MRAHNRETDFRARTEHNHLNSPGSLKHLKSVVLGFVPATRLVEKAQANAPVLTIVTPEYEAYVTQRMAFFNSEFTVELATPEDVAEAILASVNDETGQLRWVVGADQAERMHMRHETSEAEYNDWTWRQFAPAR
jgi:hypothetical protein